MALVPRPPSPKGSSLFSQHARASLSPSLPLPPSRPQDIDDGGSSLSWAPLTLQEARARSASPPPPRSFAPCPDAKLSSRPALRPALPAWPKCPGRVIAIFRGEVFPEVRGREGPEISCPSIDGHSAAGGETVAEARDVGRPADEATHDGGSQ